MKGNVDPTTVVRQTMTRYRRCSVTAGPIIGSLSAHPLEMTVGQHSDVTASYGRTLTQTKAFSLLLLL